MELKNDTILITGGTSGLGLEFAAKLLALGNTVLITGRDQSKLDRTKKQLPGLHTYQSDVSDPEQITQLCQRVTKEFPKLNLLINNAGEMRNLNLNDPSLDVWNVTREVETNLMGPIRMVQEFMPQLKKQKSAAILNVTSGIALIPFPLSPVYGATKAGLRSYTKSLRVQLKNTSIKVFELIAPAAKTPLNDKFLDEPGFDPKMMMAPNKVVDAALNGLRKDKFEVYPGAAQIMKIVSRLAPKVLFNQMAKMADVKIARDGF